MDAELSPLHSFPAMRVALHAVFRSEEQHLFRSMVSQIESFPVARGGKRILAMPEHSSETSLDISASSPIVGSSRSIFPAQQNLRFPEFSNSA